MRTALPALIAALALAAPARAQVPAGSWRMTVEVGPGQSVVFLLAFEAAGGKWDGKFLGATDQLAPDTRVEDVRVSPDHLRFVIALRDQRLAFDGKPAGNRVPGTLLVDGQLLVTSLEPSQLKAFDRYELAKEVFASAPAGSLLNQALQEMLRQATAKKVTADEARAWVDRAARAAEPFGPRWQQGVALGVVAALEGQPAFAQVALAEARRAERLIDPADEALMQLEILEAFAAALRAAGRADEAAALAPRFAQLEERDYKEALARPLLPVDPFKGRSGASERVVLAEAFTAVDLKSAAAVDIAFDALGRAYKPAEVLRLQYHLHFPTGDPMANAAAEARRKYYTLAQPPGLMLDGKLALDRGGGPAAATALWPQLTAVIGKMLEAAPDARVKVAATRAGEVVTVRASVGLPKPGEKVRLRLALVEDVVRYRGNSGLRFHPCVVRAFVGGEEGMPLTKPANEVTQTIDLTVLRRTLNVLLDAHQKANPDAAFAGRPMALKSLSVVAFVQDDATREVLQAARAEVK